MYKLQAMKGRAVVALLTVALATMGFVGTAFADDAKTDVTVTAGEIQIDVDVPLTVAASVDAQGDLTFAGNAAITNNSLFSVAVSDITVNEASGFNLVAKGGVSEEKDVYVGITTLKDSVSLNDYVGGKPVAPVDWAMGTSANNKVIDLTFEGEADFGDFDGKIKPEKVFEIVWTLAKA